METWVFTYFYRGTYRKKYIKADTAERAIKKARIKNIIDLQRRNENLERTEIVREKL